MSLVIGICVPSLDLDEQKVTELSKLLEAYEAIPQARVKIILTVQKLAAARATAPLPFQRVEFDSIESYFRTDFLFTAGGNFTYRSMAVLEFLKQHPFDVFHFTDPGTDGFYAVQTKKTGMGLERTRLIASPLLRTDSTGSATQALKDDYVYQYVKTNCDQFHDLNPNTHFPDLNLEEVRSLDRVSSPSPLRDFPKVTVCVAHFNHGAFLAQLLESLWRNKYPNFEVVIVDDGSTHAESLRIFDELSKHEAYRFWTFAKKTNGGPGQTRNHAAKLASGTFLIFMDADNIASPTQITDYIQAMNRTQADCVSCWFYAFSTESEPHPNQRIEYLYLPLGPCAELGAVDNIFGDTNFCIRREAYLKLGGFSETPGLRLEDWEFFSRLVLHGYSLAVVPKGLFYYRSLRKSWGKALDMSASYQKILQNYAELATPSLKDQVEKLKKEQVQENLKPSARPKVIEKVFRSLKRRWEWTSKKGLKFGEKGLILERSIPPPLLPAASVLTSGAGSLSENDRKNLALCIYHYDYDFLVLSYSLSMEQIGLKKDVNEQILFCSSPAARPLMGRMLRLKAGHLSSQPFAQALPELQFFDGGNCSLGSPWQKPSEYAFSEVAPLFLPKHLTQKPVIFVLPAYLAVGGVERNTIEIIKNLKAEFDFVVVSLERLTERQGSLAPEFESVSEAVYEFGEIAEPQRFLNLFRHLKAVYSPALVWICNGSVWQIKHASEIRNIFSQIPIVDQQVYDTKLGWIQHLKDPGVCESDRYIAINRRILAAFTERLQISQTKVDLIYPALQTDKFFYAVTSAEDSLRIRQKYALPPSSPIYLSVGRLTSQKRPLDFLKLAKRAQLAGQEGHFVLIGDGELKDEVSRFVKENRLGNLSLISYCGQLEELYRIVAGLIILSAYEGLPISMLEALACGVPVLSTDVGDIKLILSEYGSGMVISEFGDQDQIEESFRVWVENLAQYRTAAVQSSSAIGSRFAASTLAQKYKEVFNKAMVEKT